jgi:alpha-glucosidase
MTRASFAGGQRYAVTWTGDNSSTWDHLRLCVEQLTNLGLSGFSYSGCDVGGFIGGASPELLTRWYEIAAFTPVFRNHSANDAPRAEPWVDGPEHLAIRRKFIEERYRLMPYLYALAERNSRTGDPIMRPLFYDYPDALKLSCDQALTFSVGRDLVVAEPARPENPLPQAICLPAGGWYDYWTGQPVSEHKIMVAPKLDSVPVFVRAGAILPRQSLVQSTMERPQGALQRRTLFRRWGKHWRVEPAADHSVHGHAQGSRAALRAASGLLEAVVERDCGHRSWCARSAHDDSRSAACG